MLYLLIALGESIRILVPFIHNPIHALWSDPGRWWQYAGAGTDSAPMALMDPVLFQAWLSFVAKFTLDIPELVALYAGLLSALTPWLWYRFLRELLPSKTLALAGWALFAWLPSWIGIFSYFMTETLLLPLLGLALWLSWRSLRKRDIGSFVLAALVWILAGATRGIAAPIAAAIMPFVWWRQERRLVSAIAVSLLVAFALGWLSYRSFAKTGLIAPLGQPYLNATYARSGKREIRVEYYSGRNMGYSYVFASASLGFELFDPLSDWRPGREGTVWVRIDLDRQRESWAAEQARVAAEAPPWLELVGGNLALLMFGPPWPDRNTEHLFEWLAVHLRLFWGPLFLAALVLLWRRSLAGDRTHAPPLLLALAVWFALQGLSPLVVNEGRYRKPAEGLILAALLLGWRRPEFRRGEAQPPSPPETK